MTYREQMLQLRRAVVYQALVENGLNISATARALELHRQGFEKMLRRLNIDVQQLRENFRTASVLMEMKAVTQRERLPEERAGVVKKFRVGETKCYLTVNCFPDGRPGELFLTLDKVGSTARGFADAWATLFSIGLQHGIPLELMLAKARAMRFEPMGFTGEEDIPSVSSVLDYVARWMERKFLPLPKPPEGV